MEVEFVKKCTVEGCEKKHRSKGFCEKHYRKLADSIKKCSVDGCEEKRRRKDYCAKHYHRFAVHGDPLKLTRDYSGKCSVDGCEGEYFSNSFCLKHYKRNARHGDPIKLVIGIHKCSVDGCKEKHHCKGYCAKHFQTSKHRRDIYKKVSHKRRAKKKDAPLNDFNANDWEKSLKHFENECAYCGDKTKKIHQDHVVPIARGGSNTLTNIVPACEKCNWSKGDSLVEVWYPKQPFHSKCREMKIFSWIGYKVEKGYLQTTLF